VTDYVTKSPLKSFVIFDILRSIFTQNAEILNGDTDQLEKSKKVLVQVVNGLSSKMEIRAPMAAMYLLGQPDHYASHEFKVFYWRSYVNEVKKVWAERQGEPRSTDGEHDNAFVPEYAVDVELNEGGNVALEPEAAPENIVLNKKADMYYALSSFLDYIYRPTVYEGMSLYTWMTCAEKVKKQKERKGAKPQINSEVNEEIPVPPEGSEDTNQRQGLGSDADELSFLQKHPQVKTHTVHILEPLQHKIPNFAGGTLPRADRGNREEYCMTMLTLFKPWRTGLDLKRTNDSWDTTFGAYAFTSQDKKTMANLNLHYECNDSRDDFSAQRKKIKTRQAG
jgi:hypothetical protein